jgi:gluconolactonase
MWKNVLLRLVVCVSFCGLTLLARAAGPFEVVIGSEFSKVVDTNSAVITTNTSVTLGSGTILEGTTWVPGSPGYLLFSVFTYNNYGNTYAGLRKLVLPNTLTTNLLPPAYTVYNGSTLDNQERLITCQSGTAGLQVVMITNNTVVTSLASTCNGLKFYSPNDVVVKSDGTIWFTDPGFNGNTATPPQSGYQTGHYVYRFYPTNGNGTCSIVISNSAINRPNGLCFSPDESLLYLADYDNRYIRVYSVSSSNTLSELGHLPTLPSGNPDGIRCDADGRVYSSSGNGVQVYLPWPDGRRIGRIITSLGVNNLCFGGADRRTLFIASAPNILSIPLKVTGTASIKKLQLLPSDGTSVNVAWPWPSTGFQLQSSPTTGTGTWTQVPYSPTVSNGLNLIQFDPTTNSAAFFRLCLPSP